MCTVLNNLIKFYTIIEDTVSASVEIRSCVRCPSGTTPDVTTPNVTGFNCVTQPVSDLLYKCVALFRIVIMVTAG